VLPACLALLLGSTVARAQDSKALDGMIYTNLKEVINHGADLYNSGDWNGCYRLWEGALMTVKPMLAHHGELQKTIDTALTNARQDPMLYRRAFVLRTALDQVRTELKGGAPPKAKGTDKAPVDMPKAKTLWDRLGGEEGVTRIVDDFVNAAAADPKVDFFRHGKYKPDAVEIAKMKREMVEQVSQATGGPLKYNGPDMKKVHRDMGITDAQFDATAAHIKKALEKNKVAEQDVATVMAAINSYRKEVVAPTKPEEKKPDDKKKDKKTEDKKTEDKKPDDKKKEDKKKDDKNPAGTASVQGKVTLQGAPLAAGTITFVKNTVKVQGVIAADGTYVVKGLQPGEYTMCIQGAKANTVPAQYGDADKSPLKVSVRDGEQTCDIDLK
jgi:hemoglobin